MPIKNYNYWNSEVALDKYAKARTWNERFRSEVFFLEQIMETGMSILDVGCANGDLYVGLKEKYSSVEYTGLDVAENLLEKARLICPEVEFIHGNLLENNPFGKDDKFDLVTATGVLQHEQEFSSLVQSMLDLSNNYVLVDLKLFHTHETICDVNKAYCDHDSIIYFIVYNIRDLIGRFLQWDCIRSISFFGYYSGINESVRFSEVIDEPVCSTHVLLTKKQAEDENLHIELNLPKQLIKKAII